MSETKYEANKSKDKTRHPLLSSEYAKLIYEVSKSEPKPAWYVAPMSINMAIFNCMVNSVKALGESYLRSEGFTNKFCSFNPFVSESEIEGMLQRIKDEEGTIDFGKFLLWLAQYDTDTIMVPREGISIRESLILSAVAKYFEICEKKIGQVKFPTEFSFYLNAIRAEGCTERQFKEFLDTISLNCLCPYAEDLTTIKARVDKEVLLVYAKKLKNKKQVGKSKKSERLEIKGDSDFSDTSTCSDVNHPRMAYTKIPLVNIKVPEEKFKQKKGNWNFDDHMYLRSQAEKSLKMFNDELKGITVEYGKRCRKAEVKKGYVSLHAKEICEAIQELYFPREKKDVTLVTNWVKPMGYGQQHGPLYPHKFALGSKI